MTVETVDIVNGVAHLRITPLTRGSPTVVATLGVGGPIIASKEIDEFTLDIPAKVAIGFSGVGIGISPLTMRPSVPDLEFRFVFFGSTSTFLGGARDFTINTSAAQSTLGEPGFQQVAEGAETVDRFIYTVEMPANEHKYCFLITPYQDGVRIGFGE